MPRRLGQHFLTDPAILDRIVEALDPDSRDVVLEIGPGKGHLTRRLAGRVGQVIAIEKDRTLAEALRAPSGPGSPFPPLPDHVTVVEGDALKVSWVDCLPDPQARLSRFKVVGNIPYYITTPLIDKALTPPLAARVVFLVQREVADRLTARPGTKAYGALSVGVQCVAQVERLSVVRAGSFQPPPKVDSAVVRLIPLPSPLLRDDETEAFRRLVVGLFSQRRKQLGRAVRSVASRDKDSAEAVLDALGIPAESRAEVLHPGDFVRLFRALNR